MSSDPKEPVLDFDDEIRKLEEKLSQKFPLITTDITYKTIKAFVRSKENNSWYNRIATGTIAQGGPGGICGNPALTKVGEK